MNRKFVSSLSLMAVLVLAACGGDPAPSVRVAGDSLNDVGVFGARATVQSSTAGSPYRVWTELVAHGVGANYPCAAYTAQLTSVAGCNGFAVGGAQINPVSLTRAGGYVVDAAIGSDASAMSIIQQLKDLGKTPFAYADTVIVDGGGNDANALAQSLLEGLGGNPHAVTAYKKILKDLLPAAAVDAVADNDAMGLATLGGGYMQAAATMLSAAIKSELIAKGAQKVVVLNLPDLSKAPVLNQAPDLAKGIVAAWSGAMNAKLQAELGTESKVLILDFYTQLNGWVAAPATGSVGATQLSNVTGKACGDVGLGTCTDTLLDASDRKDWRTYLFADGLHATPFGNQLVANWALDKMKTKGWK